jgi:hypothetical protein
MLKLGFNEDISNEDYHGDREYVSSSGLKLFLKDPRKFYKVYVENEPIEQEYKSALDFGTYIHARILEPHLLDDEFAVFEGTMRRGKAWEEFKENAGEKIIITNSQKQLADRMLKTYEETEVVLGKHGHSTSVPVPSFFSEGVAEESLCGIINDIKIKVRFDYRREYEDFGEIYDVKTTSDYISSKAQVERICANFGYHISAALYVDLVTAATGKPHDFYFCFLSKKDGACRLFKASEQMLEKGREEYKKAISGLKQARKTGIYFENVIEELDAIE